MIKLDGKIRQINEIEIYNTFQKRKFWLQDIDEKYPNTWELELWKDDVNMIDNYSVGDFITAYIDIKGRVWTKNDREGVMNTLKCWNIEKDGVSFKKI